MKKCSRSLYLIGLDPTAGRMEEITMELYKSSISDITPPFIYSNRGRCLYKHKRKGNFTKWAFAIVNGLRKAGFSDDYIRATSADVLDNWRDEYFYRPAREIVQEHIELSC